ncbi:CdiA family toxin C-terminal domain-containing protein [Massilia genomosp. 1]|uniref:Uncharacterized protein n=1 Tax=Massilia genomosp. 1 TaxID=2609280 RepID=A0ABX0MWM7_9BURK|nr:CdiA family toxin C-terminal domain-containing protein [Massilia genomosp. 1]NHZ67172.1 hypothetical protein [Massilia genomosp. 1]
MSIPDILLPDAPVGNGARPAGSSGIGFDGYTPPASVTPNAQGTMRLGNSSVDVHLLDEGGLTQGKNIYGTHDMAAFKDALAKNGGTEVSSTKVPGTDGIYEVKYNLPGKAETTKTVFDPKAYTPSDMASMARSASQSAINQATVTGVTGPVTVRVGGLEWKVIG